ncbi:class I adenylate-forming enzyme family protein [Marinobacter sp. AN1]|uniref:class I adenylate-forming enzyme family protein n=1 Tax=Marinobacter sp. AN1 TaxID=2886046 RepID=UPI00222F00D2|nr:AMP-binding protein [Marinobacter sp. AN1]UZD64642.1 AMP-binding protein [Marinobacter sp. AN1]
MTTTYLDLINRGAKHYPDRTAIVYEDQTFTFKDVDQLSSQLAHALYAEGAHQGDRVALLLNNGPYSVPLDFACVKAGLNRVPLNARLSVQEHARMLKETGAQRIVFGADVTDHAEALKQALPGLKCHGLDSQIDGGDDLMASARSQPTSAPDITVNDDDVILTLFTSGTTGTLKAAQHTQASYAGVCKNVLMNLINVEHEDAMLHAASLIHASGVFVLPFWLRGAKTVIMKAFDPTAFLELIARERITAINMVPTMLQMLLGHPDFEKTDVSSLKQVIYGASPMPRPVIEKAMALWGRERFWQYYGQTECPLTITVLRPEDHEGDLLGSCGKPCVDVEVRLVDEAGNDVPHGEPGEIAIKAPSMMKGYYNTDHLNAEMFTDDGWLRTRDVAIMDERGFLHMKDRTSDMIITGGYNVYPREVEDVLMEHPAVAECSVVGTKDEKWVEAVTAAIALKPGQEVTEAELIDFVSGRLASYKKPRKVVFVDSVPKTAVGKLNRKALRDMLAG